MTSEKILNLSQKEIRFAIADIFEKHHRKAAAEKIRASLKPIETTLDNARNMPQEEIEYVVKLTKKLTYSPRQYILCDLFDLDMSDALFRAVTNSSYINGNKVKLSDSEVASNKSIYDSLEQKLFEMVQFDDHGKDLFKKFKEKQVEYYKSFIDSHPLIWHEHKDQIIQHENLVDQFNIIKIKLCEFLFDNVTEMRIGQFYLKDKLHTSARLFQYIGRDIEYECSYGNHLVKEVSNGELSHVEPESFTERTIREVDRIDEMLS